MCSYEKNLGITLLSVYLNDLGVSVPTNPYTPMNVYGSFVHNNQEYTNCDTII